MSKIVCWGDLHGNQKWKLIVQLEKYADIFISIGDEFDSKEYSGLEQMANFERLIEFKKNSNKEVILLWGNHTTAYLPGFNDVDMSGHQGGGIEVSISHLVNENKKHFQICYKHENLLFTHAGVSETWLNEVGWNGEPIDEFINDVWKYKPRSFCFDNRPPYTDNSGDNMWQSPLWIRPYSLMKDSKKLKLSGLIQIIGHTSQPIIDPKENGYWLIDTLNTSGQYLVIQDNRFIVKRTSTY